MKKIWATLTRVVQFFRSEQPPMSSEFENESARARMWSSGF